MDQIIDISLPTSLICLGIYFVILFFRYTAKRIWVSTLNKTTRGVIKWVGTMWIPLWPMIIGAIGVRFVPSIPIPQMILNLAPEPGITWTIYGAFCGMICMAVVKSIKQALEKKGIKLDISNSEDPEIAIEEELKSNSNKGQNLEEPEESKED